MAILYPGTQRLHSYTVLYTVKIYRSAVILVLEVDRPFGGRSGAIAVSLALLLLAVVDGIVLLAARPPVSVLVGWSPQLV